MKWLAVMALLFGSVASAATPPAVAPIPVKQQVLWEQLRGRIAEIESRLEGVLGIAILDLSTGQEFFLRGDEVFPQASSIKIALLAELYHQAEEAGRGVPNTAKLTDTYTVRSEDVVQDSDILGGLTPGVSVVTNRDLATMVVAVSDNAATNVLIDRVGMGNVAALMDRLGLRSTRLQRKMMDLKAAAEGRENLSTPREMMKLLEALYRGKVVTGPLKDDFFAMLGTHKMSFMTRDLPEGLKVASKPGELEGVRNESGIVFLKNRPYVLCVMTTYLANERAGEDAISAISSAVYSTLDRLDRASPYGRVVGPSNGGPH